MNKIIQNGIINVFKEKDYTSHDVIARLRGILKIKKMGHTGTLDPDAEGVLPICIGKATKLSDFITDRDKTYEATMLLGVTTNTQDISGEVIETKEVNVTNEELHRATLKYIGEYEQLPPMYSALRVDGIRLYKLAMQGIEIERKTRPVLINDIKILEFDNNINEARMAIDCGKGTYIRTLLHDIGQDLACGGTTKDLLRTRVGNFNITDSLKLSEIEDLVRNNTINNYILPIDHVLDIYPKLKVNQENDVTIQNGNPLKQSAFINYHDIDFNGYKDLIRIYDYNNNFIALYKYNINRNLFRPVKMFI